MIGLRYSCLLRPPSHACTKPIHTASHCRDHARSTTHSFRALVAAFNTPPSYGNDIDLALASLDDVGALLLTYLDGLPGGIVPMWMRHVLGDAVSIYEGNRDGGSANMRERKRAIRVAQLVLSSPTPSSAYWCTLLSFCHGFRWKRHGMGGTYTGWRGRLQG
ncbi:hypothetical protein JB92DRAFT_842851 [Gautieria morchelliformis]|nr:hypothetical protein JB92DRAFT_842851 [Gautieria morchelliformis]